MAVVKHVCFNICQVIRVLSLHIAADAIREFHFHNMSFKFKFGCKFANTKICLKITDHNSFYKTQCKRRQIIIINSAIEIGYYGEFNNTKSYGGSNTAFSLLLWIK